MEISSRKWTCTLTSSNFDSELSEKKSDVISSAEIHINNGAANEFGIEYPRMKCLVKENAKQTKLLSCEVVNYTVISCFGAKSCLTTERQQTASLFQSKNFSDSDERTLCKLVRPVSECFSFSKTGQNAQKCKTQDALEQQETRSVFAAQQFMQASHVRS